MKKLLLSFILVTFLTQICNAEDYLLDASAMAVGQTTGTNLIVKEGCLDPSDTTCTEMVRWLSAPPTKTGSLEIIGSFNGNIEISVNINVNNGSKGIVLLTEDNKSIECAFTWSSPYGGVWSDILFSPHDIGTGGDWCCGEAINLPGWNPLQSFNSLTITIIGETARIYVNGSEAVATPITLEPNTVFNRLQIKGITSDDRLSEVRVSGLQSCNTCTGCKGIYTQEQMDQMVRNILSWGDTNNDNKIGLEEAVKALQVNVGFK